MKHDRGLVGNRPFFVLEEAADVMAVAAQRFKDPAVKDQVTRACKAAAEFLFANTRRYESGKDGVEDIDEPILTAENIARLRNPDLNKYSPFALGRSKENARQRIIANGINHALVVLSEFENPVFSPQFLETADPLIFDLAGEQVMQELQIRHEIGNRVSTMTLIEAVRLVYPKASKQRQWDMRDVATVLTMVGLMTGSHSLGEGYRLRPGPVLTEVFNLAINPALARYNAY